MWLPWIRVQLLLWTVLAGAGSTPGHGTEADVCGDRARLAEQREGIPAGLVHAVALAESGRWLATTRRSRAWPWTVTSGQETHYLQSKASAVAKVRELKAQGRTNIDVGCMQVNLGYHGHAFGSLEEALDPIANVAYGAGFLRRLHAETGSWARATAYYHNRDPAVGEAYRSKVYRLWHGVRGQPGARKTVQLAGARAQQQGAAEGGRVLSFGAAEVPVEAGGSGGVLILRGR